MEDLLGLNLREFCDRLIYRHSDIGNETIAAYIEKRIQNNPYALSGLLSEVQNLIGDYYGLLADTHEGANPYEVSVKALIKEIETDWSSFNLSPFQTEMWKEAFDKVYGKNDDEELAMEEHYDLYYIFKLREKLKERISQQKAVRKSKPGRPSKPILHTYKSTYGEETLRIVYDRLKGKYISADTPWSCFLMAFSEAPVEDVSRKIRWEKSKRQLFYLLQQLVGDEPFNPAVANTCFNNKGKALNLDYNDKPENGYSELDELLLI